MPTQNGFKDNEPRCCAPQTTERHTSWYAFFSLKTKQVDFKKWLFMAATKNCFAAIEVNRLRSISGRSLPISSRLMTRIKQLCEVGSNLENSDLFSLSKHLQIQVGCNTEITTPQTYQRDFSFNLKLDGGVTMNAKKL